MESARHAIQAVDGASPRHLQDSKRGGLAFLMQLCCWLIVYRKVTPEVDSVA
jgi:hypothetical protein